MSEIVCGQDVDTAGVLAMSEHSELLVIGAGPYAYSAAAYARDRGVDTRIVGIRVCCRFG